MKAVISIMSIFTGIITFIALCVFAAFSVVIVGIYLIAAVGKMVLMNILQVMGIVEVTLVERNK